MGKFIIGCFITIPINIIFFNGWNSWTVIWIDVFILLVFWGLMKLLFDIDYFKK